MVKLLSRQRPRVSFLKKINQNQQRKIIALDAQSRFLTVHIQNPQKTTIWPCNQSTWRARNADWIDHFLSPCVWLLQRVQSKNHGQTTFHKMKSWEKAKKTSWMSTFWANDLDKWPFRFVSLLSRFVYISSFETMEPCAVALVIFTFLTCKYAISSGCRAKWGRRRVTENLCI